MDGEQPHADNSGIQETEDVVEDVLLTDAFLIRGRVRGKFSRLSSVLERYSKQFLVMSSVAMTDLRRGDIIRTPWIHINVNQIVLAHELVDASSDYYQMALTQDSTEVPIRGFYHGLVNLEIAGRIRPGAYDTGTAEQGFFIMEECSVHGLDLNVSEDFGLVSTLSYAIVNRNKLAYIYDFS